MKRIFEKAMYVIKILIAYPIALYKEDVISNQRVWLTGIQYDRYENNCKVLYEYLLSQGENVYWVLDKKNKDEMLRYIPEDRMLFRGTIKNYIYAINSKVAAYSASDFDVAPGLYKLFKTKACIVNINHGYDAIKDLGSNYYRTIPADLILCASEDEAKVKVQSFSGDKEKMRVTGYARCDQYEIRNSNEIKEIMIMPTWRPWYLVEERDYRKTPLYINYKTMLEKFVDCLDENVSISFVLHPRLADYFSQEEIYTDPHIHYVFDKHRISELLIKSDLLITDYSSISFDYIYMRKPLIMYWFDYKEYKEKVGLYKDKDSFENICMTPDQVVETYKQILLKKTRFSEKDRNRYWKYSDKSNCKRIYDTILKHKKCNN